MKYTIDTDKQTITLLSECNVHELFVVTDNIPNIKEWTIIPSIIENKLVLPSFGNMTVDPLLLGSRSSLYSILNPIEEGHNYY